MISDQNLTSGGIMSLGPLVITETVITTWGVMLLLVVLSLLISHRLSVDPSRWQSAVEGIVDAIENAITAVTPIHGDRLVPFIGTLWILLILANLVGVIPGLHSPTRDLSATAAFALLVFMAVHWFGIRLLGWRTYLSHYLKPNPILLPFHLISEITRTLALAVRLFGNIMSLEMAALLILLVAGFLVPVPILLLHIIEALVQAYIFGMLALVYVASGLQAQELEGTKRAEDEP